MKGDHTIIKIDYNPLTQRMKGITRHGGIQFDVPFISHIEGNLYMGGIRDGLVLPENIKNVISLYPWESYEVRHELDTMTTIKAYDAEMDEHLEEMLRGLSAWAVSCVISNPTALLCQAGLNRSGLLAALVLIKTGRTAEEAIELMRQKRSPAVLCNPWFERWLLEKSQKI